MVPIKMNRTIIFSAFSKYLLSLGVADDGVFEVIEPECSFIGHSRRHANLAYRKANQKNLIRQFLE
jgi:hypothetical protein